MSSAAETTSRLRLVVIATLLATLVGTLGVRLWYLQIVKGSGYRAQAASQAIREVVTQPARGLIVDDMGRPLAANKTAWVISVDRGVLNKMGASNRKIALARVAAAVKMPVASVQKKLDTFTGSRYQPVPILQEAPDDVALRIKEQPEAYPAADATQEVLRDYPQPFGVRGSGVLGYLSSVTAAEYEAAQKDHDTSLNNLSVVGRAGIEAEYDKWLRGMPGYTSVAVDALGRPIGNADAVAAQPGDTLVTSIDAKLQGFVEQQLHQSILNDRKVWDKANHRYYLADSGSAIVMEARTGRIVALASAPSYDPNVWVGGISEKDLKAMYAPNSPLLTRAIAGTYAPGSTWKPFMTAAALSDDMTPDTKLDCSSNMNIGGRIFNNFESESFGPIDFNEALNVSCDTFFYRVGLHFWNKYGSDPTNAKAKDPLGAGATSFGFGQATGIDLPGEVAGRVGSRAWKAGYYAQMKDYYCRIDREHSAKDNFTRVFAHEFCLEGNFYRQSDAANFTIGQGDNLVTPIELARAYAALANGGTVFAPTIGKAIVSSTGKILDTITPKIVGHAAVKKSAIDYVNNALLGTLTTHGGFNGTLAWKFNGFPAELGVGGKTGTAEVEGKSPTGWVATYNKDYVVVMTISQGGTGSASTGDSVRQIWQALYGVVGPENAQVIDRSKALIPGVTPPKGLPQFSSDGAILPPATGAGQ